MNARAAAAAAKLVALLDDAAAAAALLEWSSALARSLERELALVYVESTHSLLAAALPFTRVLAPRGGDWLPLSAGDVEQGFRAHVARLRQMAERVALRDALHWSLRTVRGSLPQAAIELGPEADLMLLAPPPAPGALPRAAAARCPRLVVVSGEAGPDAGLLALATRLAQALEGTVEVARTAPGRPLFEQPGLIASLRRCDLLMLARSALDAATLARLRCPVLLVG